MVLSKEEELALLGFTAANLALSKKLIEKTEELNNKKKIKKSKKVI